MEQQSIFDYMYQPFKIDKPIRLIEIFAGYGSQSMALKRLGADFEHYRAVEFDKYAMASYNAVHETNFETSDVCDITVSDLDIVEKNNYCYVMVYSFPCTDISRAGEQKGLAEGSGTRSSLLWEVKRILNELKDTDRLPQVLLMENVAALMDEQNRPHYRKWLNFLEDIGYTTYSEILNTYDYGLPQNRERVFAISLLGQYNYKFPHAISLEHCMEDFYEELTEEQAMRYVMKTDAAHDLLVELKENGTLEQENKRVG